MLPFLLILNPGDANQSENALLPHCTAQKLKSKSFYAAPRRHRPNLDRKSPMVKCLQRRVRVGILALDAR